MAKKGAALEQLIAIVQKTLKDRQGVDVKTNVKLVDTSGIRREIDVLVSDVTPEMTFQIAFECKEYSKKQVDVQVVDAIIGKYKYLPQIQRMFLVSSNGFTNNAIKRAKDENIVCSTLENLPLNEILSDTKVYNPKLKIELKKGLISLSADNKKDLDEIDCYDCYLADSNTIYDLREEIKKGLRPLYTRMLLAKKFMENGKKPFEITVTLRFYSDCLYLKNKYGANVVVDKVEIPVLIDFELEGAKIIKQQKLIQESEVVIIENEFNNNDKPYCAVLIESKDKCNFAFKFGEQYIKPSIRLR